jgi:iron complex outermembrane receptor protein
MFDKTTGRAHTWLLALVIAMPPGRAPAQGVEIEEVVVTARKREESLQEVPDAVTAFTADTLQNYGIEYAPEFMDLIPNLSFRDGRAFSKADFRMSMRGIGNGQQGWAPVTFVVDGVPADSLDSINSGALINVERVEVLRGPQSALYGAGAIAGAINVVTRKPTNELEMRGRAGYGKGDDKNFSGVVSGPLIQDKLHYRASVFYRDWDGLIDSQSNDLDLDFEEQLILVGELLLRPIEDLELHFKAEYIEEEHGSTYQDKLSSPALIEVFNDATDPRRRFAGEEEREFKKFSLKAEWEFPLATLISVTGYNDIDQDILSSICWDDPDAPAVDFDPLTPGAQVGCLFGTAFGSAAAPGDTVDNFFDAQDNYETVTQDARLVSPSQQRFRWMVGGQILDREAFNGFDAGLIVAPDDAFLTLFPAWDLREDFWWGIYGQLAYDVTDRIELTFAGRYDETEHENTRYLDGEQTTILQVPDENGVLIDTQKINDDKFQPKVQVSYQWTDDLMLYFTWSRGFRAGFFNTGAFTLSEETENYEGGIKSTWLDRRIVANLAVFHIDYSDQQFSQIINAPPFRVPVTIPETDIFGVEFEATWRANEFLTFGSSVGYLDSEQTDGTRSPIAPKWTATVLADFVHPVWNDWDLRFHADYDYTSKMFLAQSEMTGIESKDFLNLRVGVENEHWRATFYARNVLDTRMTTTQLINIAFGWVRQQNRPTMYGFELAYTY